MQKLEDLPAACRAFERAIALRPQYDLAHNSLGLTYRMMGRFEDALAEYDSALSWYARRVAESLPNAKDGAVLPHVDTVGEAWAEKAVDAMMYIGAKSGADQVTWPTGDQAEVEMRSRHHGGLLHCFVPTKNGKRAVYFLPNFFNSFREALMEDRPYAMLLNNIGAVLTELGRETEARKCFRESIEFTPDGVDYPDPHVGLSRLENRRAAWQ